MEGSSHSATPYTPGSLSEDRTHSLRVSRAEVDYSEPFCSFGKKIAQFRTQNFSVAFWVKTNEKTRYFDLAGNRTEGSHGNFFCIRMTGKHESQPEGEVVVEVDQDDHGTNYIGIRSSKNGLNDGQWHHVVAVRKSNNLKLYIDGELSAEGEAEDTAHIFNQNDFRLGRSYPHGEKTKIKFAALYIYETDLFPSEIVNLFQHTRPPAGEEPSKPFIMETQEPEVHENQPFVSLGYEQGQFGTRDFTVYFWFQTTSKARVFDVVGNRMAGSHGNFFCIRMSGQHETNPEGQICVEIDEDEFGKNYCGVAGDKTGLNDGKWHHIVVVRKERSLSLYIDGEIAGQGESDDVTDIKGGNDFRLGRSYGGFEAAKIKFRMFRIEDRALSDEEIPNLRFKKC